MRALRMLVAISAAVVTTAAATRADADEAPDAPDAPPPTTTTAPAAAAPSPSPAPVTTDPPGQGAPGGAVARVPWPSPATASGFALGYENGLWGSAFLQAIRFRIPFNPHLGLVVKGLLTHPTDHSGNVRPHYGGGRVDFIGGSAIIAGFARLYGGGGIHVATKILGTGGNTDVHVGGGGYFGFEFFLTRSLSWVAEIGGGSGVDGSAAGATVIAGMQWFPGQ